MKFVARPKLGGILLTLCVLFLFFSDHALADRIIVERPTPFGYSRESLEGTISDTRIDGITFRAADGKVLSLAWKDLKIESWAGVTDAPQIFAAATKLMAEGDRLVGANEFGTAVASYREAERQLSAIRQQAAKFAVQIGLRSAPFDEAKIKIAQCQARRKLAMELVETRNQCSQALRQATDGSMPLAIGTLSTASRRLQDFVGSAPDDGRPALKATLLQEARRVDGLRSTLDKVALPLATPIQATMSVEDLRKLIKQCEAAASELVRAKAEFADAGVALEAVAGAVKERQTRLTEMVDRKLQTDGVNRLEKRIDGLLNTVQSLLESVDSLRRTHKYAQARSNLKNTKQIMTSLSSEKLTPLQAGILGKFTARLSEEEGLIEAEELKTEADRLAAGGKLEDSAQAIVLYDQAERVCSRTASETAFALQGRIMDARWKTSRRQPLLKIKKYRYHSGAAVVLLSVLCVAVIYMRRPEVIERRSLNEVSEIESGGRPAFSAEKKYRRIIDQLDRLSRRKALGSAGREALGKALFGEALILLTRKEQRAEGYAQHKRAKEYISVSDDDVTLLLVRIFLEKKEASDEALEHYVAYLRLPANKAEKAIALQISELLAAFLKITEATSGEDLEHKILWNAILATVPGPPPRLVIIGGDVEIGDSGPQFELPALLSIGRELDNNLVLENFSVSRHHAVVETKEGNVTIRDLGSTGGTTVRGKVIKGPTALADGDRIQCGGMTLGYYAVSRPLNLELAWPHFHLGLAYFVQEIFASAASEFRKAIALQPENADAHWYLARTYHALEEYERSFGHFEATARLDPANAPRAQHAWGLALLKHAEVSAPPREPHWREAIGHLLKAVELAPQQVTYSYDLARALERAGRPEEAIKAVQHAIELQGDVPEYHVLLARLARSTANTPLAKQGAGRALDLDNTHLEANQIVGDLSFEEGDYEDASLRYEWVRAEELNTERAIFSGTDPFRYRLGRSLFETGRHLPALIALEEVTQPNREVVYYKGRCFSGTGQFESATAAFQTVLDRYGEESDARYYLASSYGNLGRYEDGLQAAAGLNGEGRAVCLRGRLLARMKRIPEALATLRAGVRQFPANGAIAFEAGRLELIQGDLRDAEVDFVAALKANSADAEARFWLARVYLIQGRHDAAREQFIAVRNAPSITAQANFYLGQIARSRGEAAVALQHLEEARQGGCVRDDLVFELAASYAETGRNSSALSEFSQLALKTDSDGKVDSIVAHNLAAVACRIGNSHMEAHSYAEAVPLLQQAVESFAGVGAETERKEAARALAEANFRLGVLAVFFGAGQLSAGIAALHRARDLDSEDPRFAYYLGAGYFRGGDFAKAVEIFAAIPGGTDPLVAKALALSLERSGALTEAEAVWRKAAASAVDTPPVWIEAQLGFAGFQARRQAWREAAEILNQVLDHKAAKAHPSYQEICKLTTSYFSLAGDHAAAETVIRAHLSAMSPEIAEGYLGAILARQNRPVDAFDFLHRAVKSGKPDQPLRDLLDAVSRAVAAHKVLAGKLGDAVGVIKSVSGVQPLSAPTRNFLEEIELALLLGEGVGEVNAKAIGVYEKAQKSDPKNPKILRNLAILYHRMAIRHEEKGETGKADGFWSKACKLWGDIGHDRNNFWRSYTVAYNEGRHARDQFKESNVAAVRERVLAGVSEVNVEFARQYLAKGEIGQVKRHANYAKSVATARPFIEKLATTLREEGSRALRERFPALAELAEYIQSDLLPNKENKDFAFNLYFEAAVSALWSAQVADYQKYLSKAGHFADDAADVFQKPAATDRAYLESVVRQTRPMLNAIDNLDVAKGKMVLFYVVLKMCALWHQVPSYQRHLIDQKMSEFLPQIFLESVTTVANAGK